MKSRFFRSYITALFALAFMATLTSCSDYVLRGEGENISETRTVGSFDKINASGNFEIYLTQGPAQDIQLEAPENVLAEVNVLTRNNKLEIEFDRNRVRLKEPVKVYITTPNLWSLNLSGRNTARGLNTWHVNNLDISTSGRAEIDLTVEAAGKIETHTSGAGKITLYGSATTLESHISGSGELKTYGLATKIADIEISGSGKSEVTVSESLEARISGSGKVRYKGNPTVSTSISGSGSVEKAD